MIITKERRRESRLNELSLGMLVLQRNLRNESRKGGKMEPKWTGPYKILDIDSNQRVGLEIAKNGKKNSTDVFPTTSYGHISTVSCMMQGRLLG
ncbi:hypothetical protein E2C01_051949 [Portunus trituberculatus]|uniref:Uncharacterized protein n=1 Tax=Portunus trituberculatus TaxID=210409 RepID=A0A5B7GL15_PORTR|nr:hypothetical protein [Portunus trituberculatus]